ncbi:response regulator [Paenibacillaceae bacterium WGS1546]|uniref:response regulator n=1 Tax=Cohnella sp. WGS1546 TaxID=3366810 RepID=UPI00372D6AC8
MRTLLIADDERNIRLGLKTMIEREYPGAYAIRLAADGRQALEEFEREPADIVLTDIRMPHMDGIELIGRLTEAPRRPAMLILSGYDDFQYAKEAIKHKVKEYLLKPIVREDLFAALGKIESELAEREAISGKLESADKYLLGMKINTLRHIWSGADIAPETVAALAEEAGLKEFEPNFRVAILECPDNPRNLLKGSDFLALHREGTRALSYEDKAGRLVVLSSGEELLQGMAAALASSSESQGTYAIGLSERGETIGELRTKYEEARHALKYRLLLGRSNTAVIPYGRVASRSRDYPVPVEAIGKLAHMVGTDRDKEMKALLLELFAEKALAEADIGYVEAVSRLLNEKVFDRIFHVYGDASVEIIKMYKLAGDPFHFAHIQDYIHCVNDLLFALNDYIRHLKSAHFDRKDIAMALDYIRDNYDKDISMTMVSNYVSLNYSYFSQAFKEYTGMSFVQYLKSLRIDKAKELLATTELKVMEIGERVGFENTKHFNRVFRETVGVAPLEYRQSASGREHGHSH